MSGQGSPPSRRRVGVEFWAMEFVQHVEFLSFRKMNGVEYLARFSSCLIEKGLDKVENWWEKLWLPGELTWGPGWISVEFWATTFLPSVDCLTRGGYIDRCISFPVISGAHTESRRLLYGSFSRPPPPLRCFAKSSNSVHAHWVVGKWGQFRNDITAGWRKPSRVRCLARHL
jgi:hypothetical protein